MWGPDIISDYITVRRPEQQQEQEKAEEEEEEESGWLNFVPVPSLLPLLSSPVDLLLQPNGTSRFGEWGQWAKVENSFSASLPEESWKKNTEAFGGARRTSTGIAVFPVPPPSLVFY